MTETQVTQTLLAAGEETQYDECIKKILANKKILAYILRNTVKEFKGMNPDEIAACIEGEPQISTVPIAGGRTNQFFHSDSKKTNQKLERMKESYNKNLPENQTISGMNTEDSEIGEGLIRYDIIFYVRTKDGVSQIIVNVEAQKNEPNTYDILNRAIFYTSRMISSQKNRDFDNMQYNDMKEVYSIWLCMNMKGPSIHHIHLTNEELIGHHDWKGNLDIFNIVMVGIAENLPEQSERYELNRLLTTLLSQNIKERDKLSIIEKEYGIVTDDGLTEEVEQMCNLGQGLLERGISQGIVEGEARGESRGIAIGEERGREAGLLEGKVQMIRKLYQLEYSIEAIAEIAEMPEKQIREILAI